MVESIDSSALVPMEDTIEALLEYLVSPLLPIRESKDEVPTESQQKMVAKQMHAVVMLYNYYHRKQFPKHEVLGLESCCKICCISKPGLLAYMRYMLRSEDDPENLNQFSVTEKMVIDSCNICTGLDSSKDFPDIKGWPISKVAAFLVDPMKEKCVLQFCSNTQGTWSLVEKVLESHKEKTGEKHGKNVLYESEEVLEQLAYSVVEQETGIIRINLSILERHLTYSLTHDKSTTRLYIMTYGVAAREELTEVAIKDVIRSLEGPIVKRALTSEVEVTSVVEYYNLLPYIQIISNWLSRRNTDCDSLHSRRQQVVNEDECTLRTNCLPLMEDHEVNKNSVPNDRKVDMNDTNLSRRKHETIETNRKDQSFVMDMNGSNPNRRKSETLETNRKDQSLVNGSSGASNTSKDTVDTKLDEERLSIMKDQTMSDKCLMKDPDDEILDKKKNKPREPITYIRKVGRSSKSTSSCKAVDSKRCLVFNKIPAVEDNGTTNLSGLNEQNFSIISNNTARTENQTIEKSINDLPLINGSSCEVSRLQNSADNCQVKADRPDTRKDNAMNDKFLKTVQTKDIVVCKKNNTENKDVGNKDVGGSCTSASTGAVDSCKGDSSSLNFHQQFSPSEDIGGKSIIPDSCVDEGKVSVDNGLTFQMHGYDQFNKVDGFPSIYKGGNFCIDDSSSLNHHQQLSPSEVISGGRLIPDSCIDKGKVSVDNGVTFHADGSNKTGAVESIEKACIIYCTGEMKTNARDSNQDGFVLGDLPLVPVQFSSNDHSTFYHMMASKKNDLLHAALRVFQKKRNGLLQQQRLFEDEIARCEMNMQIILSEGEESMPSKVESIIEALNSVCSGQTQMGMILSSEEENPSQDFKRRKLSVADLTPNFFCQELDNICNINSWMLPRYRVLPPSVDCHDTGSYQAAVTLQGLDFEFTCEGNLKSSPLEARESAASHMLSKLRNEADQEQ